MDLSQLLPGEKAEIVNIKGKKVIKRRMMDIGLISGIDIKMIKRAPFNDPLQVSIRGLDIIIRKNEAQNIGIKKK